MDSLSWVVVSMREHLRPAAKTLAYRARALSVYHRVRNRSTLTVVMFHRVLSVRDPRWKTCDPEYSISEELFRSTLAFFAEHYTVVGLDDVRAARAGTHELPERALLITFDDGWADNAEFALEPLRRAGMPAVVFVVSDAIGRRAPFFQEQLVIGHRTARLDPRACRELWLAAGGDPLREPRWSRDPDELAPLRELVTRLEALDELHRAAVLSLVAAQLADEHVHMVTPSQLLRMSRAGIAIGSHGRTHAPLPRCRDELRASRHLLAQQVGSPPISLSFPHGRYDSATVVAARASGYELLFTSDPIVNSLPGGKPSFLLGRIAFTTAGVTDRAGAFRPELLALRLFRAAQRPLRL